MTMKMMTQQKKNTENDDTDSEEVEENKGVDEERDA